MSQFHFRGERRLRAEQFLKQCLPTFSMQSLRAQLEKGALRLRPYGKSVELALRKGTYLTPGDTVIWPDLPDLETVPAKDSSIKVVVRYQDDAMLAVDKPAGVPTYPLSPLEKGTLANGLVAQFPQLAGIGVNPLEAGIVHR